MLHAHSLLWHYLWLAPDILQLALAVVLYRRGFHKAYPVFFSYLIYEAIETFTLYAMDILPSVSIESYWRVFWVSLVVGGLVKFAVIGELLRHLTRSRPALGRDADLTFNCAAVGLTLLAVVTAAYTTPHNPHWLIGGALLLLQATYIVQCGLVLLVFILAAYFRLTWDRSTFGIALGFAIVFCQHLASRAVEVSVALPDNGVVFDFLNMATYHVCVLMWCYYLLVPQKKPATSTAALPENNLAVWNRELERLLQK
jgi:hypothetical protein